MANTQILKQRIKSVGNIMQITKAMEMVAASKLRRAQEAALHSRAYAVAAREALVRLRLLTEEAGHVFFREREVKTQLLILFSSDRGLAGAYNTNLFKVMLAEITRAEKKGVRTKVVAVGSKGASFVTKLGTAVEVIGVYTNWPVQPDPVSIRPLMDTAREEFVREKVDRVRIIYTDFESILKQQVQVKDLLPINYEQIIGEMVEVGGDTLFEPSATAVLEHIIPRLIEVQLYQASLEAVASEQAMRMIAMKNASDNANDLTKDLTQTFNGLRQAAITQELAEITSGTEALQS